MYITITYSGLRLPLRSEGNRVARGLLGRYNSHRIYPDEARRPSRKVWRWDGIGDLGDDWWGGETHFQDNEPERKNATVPCSMWSGP